MHRHMHTQTHRTCIHTHTHAHTPVHGYACTHVEHVSDLQDSRGPGTPFPLHPSLFVTSPHSVSHEEHFSGPGSRLSCRVSCRPRQGVLSRRLLLAGLPQSNLCPAHYWAPGEAGQRAPYHTGLARNCSLAHVALALASVCQPRCTAHCSRRPAPRLCSPRHVPSPPPLEGCLTCFPGLALCHLSHC